MLLRSESELFWFPPWSLWLVPTIPLALLSVLDAAPWLRRPSGGPGPVAARLPAWLWDREAGADARFVRGGLAALWLVDDKRVRDGLECVAESEGCCGRRRVDP